MFWILAIILALAAAFFIAFPLLRAAEADSSGFANDAEVYRDQLEEVDRDEKAGALATPEATQARAEIARRLIATSGSADVSVRPLTRPVALVLALCLLVFVPVTATLVYQRMGSPTLPDQPLAARFASPEPDINILIAKTENHLAAHPEDGKGWELLAPIYMRTMRTAEAVNAYRNAIKVLGGDAIRYGSLGEALAAQAAGKVTPEALIAFNLSLAIDPADPRSRFYVALADSQAGKFDEALAKFAALRKDSPADAPWLGVVDAQVADITASRNQKPGTLGNPDQADIDAAAGLNAEDRMQMIRTMVEGLDAKLTDDPNNFEGWLRLVRSYGVLQQPDKAAEALKRGLAAFPADSDNGKALLALGREMGLSVQ